MKTEFYMKTVVTKTGLGFWAEVYFNIKFQEIWVWDRKVSPQ